MPKPETCKGCALFNEPGPVGYDGAELPEVVFFGEALGFHEVKNRRPFVGQAGQVLRQSITQMDICNFGIDNIWRCRPPHNKLPEGEEPGQYCKDELKRILDLSSIRVVVPLGATALDALTEYSFGITQVQSRWLSTSRDGRRLILLPMYHPAYLLYQRLLWRDWEVGMGKLKRYLDGNGTDYIPLAKRKVHQARTTAQALNFLKRLRDFKTLSCDIETASFNMPWEGGYILSISFGWSITEACAIPWHLVEDSDVRQAMKELLEDPKIYWLWYNGQFDVQFLWAESIDARIDGDAMVSAALLDERLNMHSLKRDAGTWLDAPDWEEGLKKYKIPKDTSEEAQEMWQQIPESELLEYNGQDVCHTLHLQNVLRKASDEGLLYVHDNIQAPAMNMLAKARHIGTRVDMYKVKELRDTFAPVLEELTRDLIGLTENAFFNPNSWQDKLAALHARGLKAKDTRKDTLKEFEGDELADLLIAYSEAHKMYSTYVVGIADDVSDDLRVHPDWRSETTENGRLRCSNPNMLGMPRKAEEEEHRWKRRIKEMFVADPDTLLFHIDQGQSELRCACFLSQDPKLLEILRSGHDFHSAMAEMIYGPNFTYEQRVLAKMVTFGLIYNREAPSLARQFTAVARFEARRRGEKTWHVWTVREAQKVIDRFFEQMPTLLEWKKDIMHEALTTQMLTSHLGRKRRFGLITYRNRKHVENEAVNFPPASLSTDLNLLNCLEATKRFAKYGMIIYVPIHDAALGRIPKSEVGVLDEMKNLFETHPQDYIGTDVPFKADVTVGERWSDL